MNRATAVNDGLTPYELATGFAGSCAAVLATAGANDHDVAETFRALADCFDGRGASQEAHHQYQETKNDDY